MSLSSTTQIDIISIQLPFQVDLIFCNTLEEPFSKMLVRERLEGNEKKNRAKVQNRIDMGRGKRVDKRAEDGSDKVLINNDRGLDRDYQDQLGQSPLKYRPDLDIYGEGYKNN